MDRIWIIGAAITWVACGYYLGRRAGIKSTMDAMEEVLTRVVRDVNAGRSLDWLEKSNREDS